MSTRFKPLILLSLALAPFAAAYTCAAAPQSMTLNSVSVDLSRPAAAKHNAPPVELPRHFANPTLIGQIKASLAAATKSPGPSRHGGGGSTPTPTPTPAPSTAPLSAIAPNAVPTTTAFAALGILDGGGYMPPDTTLTAGSVSGSTSEVLEAVNLAGEVYSTAGGAVASLSITNCTPNAALDSLSDPRVLFDSASGRWFISLITFSPISDAGWDLLVSPGSDPSAANWACLHIPTGSIRNPDGSTGNFPDFPKIGINENKVVLTGDAFSAVRRGYKFQGTEFVVINLSDLLLPAGSLVHTALFGPPEGDFAIEPAQQLAPTSATTTSNPDNLYMASVNSAVSSTSALDVWTVSGVPSATTTPSLTRTALPIFTISTPPNAQQAGTGVLIDTNDDSLLDAVFRDGSPGSLWVSANDACVPAGDNATRSCLRFMEVSIDAGVMSMVQDFDYGSQGFYYYYPAVRTNGAGDLVTSFSGSSSATYASVYAGRRLAGDPANNLTGFSMLQVGAGAYNLSMPRWGDYSGAGVDPDDTTIWLGGEYVASIDPFFGPLWGTWITSVP